MSMNAIAVGLSTRLGGGSFFNLAAYLGLQAGRFGYGEGEGEGNLPVLDRRERKPKSQGYAREANHPVGHR